MNTEKCVCCQAKLQGIIQPSTGKPFECCCRRDGTYRLKEGMKRIGFLEGFNNHTKQGVKN
jgi:hypothetical protein